MKSAFSDNRAKTAISESGTRGPGSVQPLSENPTYHSRTREHYPTMQGEGPYYMKWRYCCWYEARPWSADRECDGRPAMRDVHGTIRCAGAAANQKSVGVR